MPNSLNPRTERARNAIVNATFDLVSERAVSQISLTEIAEAAGVSRPTVYKLFSDTPTLVAVITEESLDQALTRIDENLDEADERVYFRRLMDQFVDAVYAHKEFYRNAIYGPSAARIMTDVSRMLDERMRTRRVGKRLAAADTHADDCRAAISAGVVWLLVRWLSSDFVGDDAPESIARRIADTMFTLSAASSE